MRPVAVSNRVSAAGQSSLSDLDFVFVRVGDELQLIGDAEGTERQKPDHSLTSSCKFVAPIRLKRL